MPSAKPSRKAAFADLPAGALSPLDAAVSRRDGDTLDMVSRAIAHNDVMLAFQPIVLVGPPHRPAFYEGLIRVLDPGGRVIPARDFMSAVEPTELGRDIDCASLDAGLKTLARVPDIRVSVNMSARSIGYRKWMRVLDRGLKRSPTIAERLILEITEQSAITVPELVTEFMFELRDKGIAFVLDEFGADQTAIGRFRDFLFDAVKIHGQFSRGVHANPDNQAVVASLTAIAQQFDMFTIACFVEDERDAATLAGLGVDCLQGHLFGAATIRPPWIANLQARTSA
ncbi:MAG: EAL domain-containing protein [Marinibacterium sp.]